MLVYWELCGVIELVNCILSGWRAHWMPLHVVMTIMDFTLMDTITLEFHTTMVLCLAVVVILPRECVVLLSNIPLLYHSTTLDVRFIISSSSGHSQHCQSFISLSMWHLTCSQFSMFTRAWYPCSNKMVNVGKMSVKLLWICMRW